MRTRTEPAWATDHRISPSCGTWHSTSCRRMARRRRCAASFSGPDGTTPISPASWLYSEVQLPWGSSSIKFALCGLTANADIPYRGQVEGIGVDPRLKVRNAHGETIAERTWPAAGFDHNAAAEAILHTGASLAAGTVAGIGHRVVHGGLTYDAPVRLDQGVVETL